MTDLNIPKVGVGVIVLKNEKDKTFVLLHQRKRLPGQGMWGSGGGHLELGESFQDAVMREMREEAGDAFKMKNIKFLCALNYTPYPAHYVGIEFIADWAGGEATNNAPEETTDWKWFAVDELPSPMFPPVENCITALRTGQNFFDSSHAQTDSKM